MKTLALLLVLVVALASGCVGGPPASGTPLTHAQVVEGKAKADDVLLIAKTAYATAEAQAASEQMKADALHDQVTHLPPGDSAIAELNRKADKAEQTVTTIRLGMIALQLGVQFAQNDVDRWAALLAATP